MPYHPIHLCKSVNSVGVFLYKYFREFREICGRIMPKAWVWQGCHTLLRSFCEFREFCGSSLYKSHLCKSVKSVGVFSISTSVNSVKSVGVFSSLYSVGALELEFHACTSHYPDARLLHVAQVVVVMVGDIVSLYIYIVCRRRPLQAHIHLSVRMITVHALLPT